MDLWFSEVHTPDVKLSLRQPSNSTLEKVNGRILKS
ncbi:hypothetical protein D065_04248 [Streptococcus mitis 13/39]|uniref:Uncharacterized protein n=1 Tax=Streptococcus mitis 13/39 TaxID=1239793 RepID=R0MF14_STRMT|nr:hypothetical protein D065_04248 [Streptococcus mitis 13/39]